MEQKTGWSLNKAIVIWSAVGSAISFAIGDRMFAVYLLALALGAFIVWSWNSFE